MQKKVMAVAVAGALGALTAPAVLAQTSTVQIGGSIHVIYVNSRSGTTTQPNHDNIATSEPELFVRGEESLGGGMAAWFQCTSTFDVIGLAANGFCGRNSGIGMKGAWGNIFVGNWDLPNKLMVTPIRGWFGLNNVYASDGRMLWANPGSGATAGNTGASFHRRSKNSVNYHSPDWSGFSFRAAYTTQNEATSLAAATLPSKPRLWAADVTYRAGPLYLGAGYERHKNFNPGGVAIGAGTSAYAGGDDYNWTLGASYTFGGFLRLGAVWTRSNYDITNSTELRKDGWWLIGDWTISGPHSLKAKFSKVGDTKGSGGTTGSVAAGPHRPGTAGTGGKVWGINYAYEFSKRTTGYIGYNRVNADTSSSYSLGLAASSTGGTQRVYGLGWRHRF